jgi:hypothetical protein
MIEESLAKPPTCTNQQGSTQHFSRNVPYEKALTPVLTGADEILARPVTTAVRADFSATLNLADRVRGEPRANETPALPALGDLPQNQAVCAELWPETGKRSACLQVRSQGSADFSVLHGGWPAVGCDSVHGSGRGPQELRAFHLGLVAGGRLRPSGAPLGREHGRAVLAGRVGGSTVLARPDTGTPSEASDDDLLISKLYYRDQDDEVPYPDFAVPPLRSSVGAAKASRDDVRSLQVVAMGNPQTESAEEA